MRTGTGNRTNYNRTTGSRTARLYSKRTAKNINRVYQQQTREEERRRVRQNTRYDQYDYDDYYDRPRSSSKSKGSSKSKSTPVIVATMIVIVLAVVFVALALMKPANQPVNNVVQETTPDAAAVEQPSTEAAVMEESDPPVIYGIIPIVVYEGHSVAYKQGIYVEDDTDPAPTLEVDNEYVDLSTPGTYIVSYIARDKDGNVTREATSVTVLEGANMVSDEEIYALADSILGKIVNDYMTDAEKCLRDRKSVV